ncbi:MAG TPA: dihydrofolate reductase [Kiritimatiellia bacterium]|nr:dihydrofolate reductase [Kiritimatiellia bacterium]
MRCRWTLVVAMTKSGVIGREGALPWRLPEDLRRFKAATMGKPVLMGRKTWDSIGRALPGRRNLVLTRSPSVEFEGAERVGSLAEVEHLVGPEGEVMVIGGGEVYRLCLPVSERILVTYVDAEVVGDTSFPPFNASEWEEVSREDWPVDERHAYPMAFVELRKSAEKNE